MNRNCNRALVQSLIISLLPLAGAFAGPVNLNSADAATLAKELDGIGPAKAQAIVEYRQKNGPFRSRRRPAQGRRHRPEGARAEPRQHPPREGGRSRRGAQKPAGKSAAKQAAGD